MFWFPFALRGRPESNRIPSSLVGATYANLMPRCQGRLHIHALRSGSIPALRHRSFE